MRDELAKSLNEAVKSKDKRRVCTRRLINAAIKDRDIANRGAGKDPVSEDDIRLILAKMVKQREESAQIYEEGNRLDLADRGAGGTETLAFHDRAVRQHQKGGRPALGPGRRLARHCRSFPG